MPTERWRDLLPWRYPFLALDSLVECVPHARITTRRRVTGDDLLALAHGKGGPVIPGVMVLEGLNQSAALLYRLSYDLGEGTRLPLLGHLRAEFPGTAAPGDTITYTVRAVRMTPTHGLFEGEARVGGAIIVKGELGFAMAPAPPGGPGRCD